MSERGAGISRREFLRGSAAAFLLSGVKWPGGEGEPGSEISLPSLYRFPRELIPVGIGGGGAIEFSSEDQRQEVATNAVDRVFELMGHHLSWARLGGNGEVEYLLPAESTKFARWLEEWYSEKKGEELRFFREIVRVDRDGGVFLAAKGPDNESIPVKLGVVTAFKLNVRDLNGNQVFYKDRESGEKKPLQLERDQPLLFIDPKQVLGREVVRTISGEDYEMVGVVVPPELAHEVGERTPILWVAREYLKEVNVVEIGEAETEIPQDETRSVEAELLSSLEETSDHFQVFWHGNIGLNTEAFPDAERRVEETYLYGFYIALREKGLIAQDTRWEDIKEKLRNTPYALPIHHALDSRSGYKEFLPEAEAVVYSNKPIHVVYLPAELKRLVMVYPDGYNGDPHGFGYGINSHGDLVIFMYKGDARPGEQTQRVASSSLLSSIAFLQAPKKVRIGRTIDAFRWFGKDMRVQGLPKGVEELYEYLRSGKGYIVISPDRSITRAIKVQE
jgi:hypothetical protein